MRITPQIVWARNLSDEDFHNAIKLQSSFTHQNPIVQEATYLYSWAIRRLIKDPEVIPSALYQETRDLCYERMIKG
jgi:ADP-ribosylglycohydrolase